MNHAFTLIEMLITLLIISVLLVIAIPRPQYILATQIADTEINKISTTVRLARALAIKSGYTVTLCPSSNGQHCEENWQAGQLIFTDKNNNGQVEDKADIKHVVGPISARGKLYWRAFPDGTYLQFLPTGTTNYQNGTFIYCPSTGNARHARALFITQSGRIRHSHDHDKDNVHEDWDGKPLSCRS